MNQNYTNKTKKGFYYCPVCNEPIKIIKGTLRYVCLHCKHKLKVETETRTGITYFRLSVCNESVYCPSCSHALKIESPPLSGDDTYYHCINPDCKEFKSKTRLNTDTLQKM